MALIKVAFLSLLTLELTAGFMAQALPGLLKAAPGSAPAAVVAASQRALEIWVPAGSYTAYPSSHYEIFESALRGKVSSNARVLMHYKINLAELRMCRTHNRSNCLLSSNVSRGTGFVINGSELVTVRHTFSTIIEQGNSGMGIAEGVSGRFAALSTLYARQLAIEAERTEATQRLRAFVSDPLAETVFLISDVTGRIIFDSSRKAYSFLRYGALTNFRGEYNANGGSAGLNLHLRGDAGAAEALAFGADQAWLLDDVVRISLSGVSAPNMAIAQSGCEAGSDAFNVGFPMQTTTRQRIGYQDAPDRRLSISVGRNVPIADALLLGREGENNAQFLESVKGKNAVINDADSASGMSGGMMLNTQGEVCGLLKGNVSPSGEYHYDSGLGAYLMYTVGVRLAPGVIN